MALILPAMTGITGSHHVLGVKHLLGELRHGQGAVLLAAAGGQRSEARHEKVKPGEGHHVDCKFTQVSVQLARESETGGNAGHCEGDKVVQVTLGGGGKLQSPKNKEM